MASARVLVHDAASRRWLAFAGCRRIVQASTIAAIPPVLTAVETALGEGLCAAGFIAYEAAAGFDRVLVTRAPEPGQPLVWFGLFERAEPAPPPAPDPDAYRLGDWQPSISEAQYRDRLAAIRGWLRAGDSYQVNFTFRLRARFEGDPLALLGVLDQAQGGAYGGFIDTGEWAIASASPELFFTLDAGRITGKPMKGTAPRGRTLAEDAANRAALAASIKDRAENLMIVDMVRNDLARIARLGSVRVPRLFEVERYPRVLQMTTTVTAATDAGLSRLLAALFPCASITGAPKVRTMALIRELECSPRGVYTGSLGFCLPDGRMQFNVAIRTAVVDRRRGEVSFGTGSGVVWDSQAEDEYRECLTKANILSRPPAPFALLETLLWTPADGYALLDRHIERLAASAGYFDIACDPDTVRRHLQATAPAAGESQRVRLLLHRDGRLETEIAPLAPSPEPVRVALAREPVDRTDPFLFHKTTRREVYQRAAAGRPDCADVILWNRAGELTESTIANLVLELDGRYLTPALDCGLLPGTLRRQLLTDGAIEEARLPLAALHQARRLWLINSVRGWRQAHLVG